MTFVKKNPDRLCLQAVKNKPGGGGGGAFDQNSPESTPTMSKIS